MSPMFNPPHPGETLKEDVLPALGLSVTEAAVQLGVSRVPLSRVINSRAPISPELALRLEQRITSPTADIWLRMQTSHDLWQARKTGIRPVTPARRLPESA